MICAILVIGSLSLNEIWWGLPLASHPDWQCSFAANGVGIPNIPAGPAFAILRAVDRILRDDTSPSTGRIPHSRDRGKGLGRTLDEVAAGVVPAPLANIG